MAVQLASHYIFGEASMACHTAGTLEPSRMRRIKAIVISKFGGKRSEADKEALWARCKIAIGQKCKMLRLAKKGNLQ